MKVLDVGHLYELDNFEAGGLSQQLQFINKVNKTDEHGEVHLVTLKNGTTNEEVLKVLLDRLHALQAKYACRENSIAITKLEEALMWLEKRTANRVARKVEGKPLA